MIEFLLNQPTRKGIFYPNSGPGTKFLVSGTTAYGYFGEVSDSDLGVVDQLLAAAPTDRVVSTFQKSSKWLKWYYGDRVLFYPTCPVMLASYDTITSMKATFNSEQAGTPNVPSIIPQYNNQPIWSNNLIVRAADNTFYRVRLFDFVKNSGIASGTNFEPTSGEFFDIFASVFRVNMTSSIGLKLNPGLLSNMATDYGNSFLFWGQEITSVGLNALAFNGASGQGNFARGSMIASSSPLIGWIPVLERLTTTEVDNLVFPVSRLSANSTVPEMGGSLTFNLGDTIFPAVNIRSSLPVSPTFELTNSPMSFAVQSIRAAGVPGPFAPDIYFGE